VPVGTPVATLINAVMRSEIYGTLLRSIFKSVYEYEGTIWCERSEGFYRGTGTRNRIAFGISSVKGVGIFAKEKVSCRI
jgi:hypothetical protein